MSCRRLHTLIEPILNRYYAESHSNLFQWRHFLFTILAKPHLARHVRWVSLWGEIPHFKCHDLLTPPTDDKCREIEIIQGLIDEITLELGISQLKRMSLVRFVMGRDQTDDESLVNNAIQGLGLSDSDRLDWVQAVMFRD